MKCMENKVDSGFRLMNCSKGSNILFIDMHQSVEKIPLEVDRSLFDDLPLDP